MIFKGENLQPGLINFNPTSAPAGAGANNAQAAGELWYDATQGSYQFTPSGVQAGLVGVVAANITPVSQTNPLTSLQALMTFVFPAGSLNVVGRTIRITSSGIYTLGAVTPTLTFGVQLGSVTLASFTSGATTSAAASMPWQLDALFTVAAKGATGTLEVHGSLGVTLGSSAGAAQTWYADTNTAVSSAVDLTAAETLTIGTFTSATNASNVITERVLVVEVLN